MKRWLLIACWAVGLAVWGWLLGRHLQVAADLTLFMPEAASDVEHVLIHQLREGPVSRLVLIAIEGEKPETLARVSRAFAADLRQQPEFIRAENGEQRVDPRLRDLVLQYRYLLSPLNDAARFAEPGLRAALEERLRDLASPAEFLLRDLLPRDPTGEMLAILRHWQPADAPRLFRGVWLSPDGKRALLLAETRAQGFDIDAQAAALARVHARFESAAQGTGARLSITGPGPFGVAIEKKSKRDAQLFSVIDSVMLSCWLLLGFRSVRLVLLAFLPIGSGVLAGLTAVQMFYGSIHGITLAFGTTLLGVALDYPVHVFSHRLPGPSPWQGLRHNWPTLWIGVAAACIAYLALIFTDFTGLAQLGVFTVAGLLAAALCTRWLLPGLLTEQPLDVSRSPAMRWQMRLDRLPPLRWLSPAIVVAALLILVLSPRELWETDLGSLSPVPQDLQDADTKLRQDLGTADVRYVALLTAPSEQVALDGGHALAKKLDALVAGGEITGYEIASRFLPSETVQRQRQQQLPEPERLRVDLAAALRGLPFQDGLFDPFLSDIEASRALLPLTSAQLQGSVLGTRLSALLAQHRNHWVAVVPLHGIRSPDALRRWFERSGGKDVQFFDLKSESEGLMTRFRGEMLERVGVAVLIMVAVMALGLRRKTALPLVVLPAAATVLGLAATLHLLGWRFNVFHLVSLMLVMGITIDYALYLSRDEQDASGRARSLHSLLVCCLSTATGFGILALSEIPVLRAIGATVASGVVLGLVLGVLGARTAIRHT